MWHINKHEIVLTGSFIDPELWVAAFMLRCYGCPGTGGLRREDAFIWRTSEDHDPRDFVVDFQAAIDALVEHIGVGVLAEDDVRAAVFMAAFVGRLDAGLATIADDNP
jgi:hypothetical protein